MTTLKYYLNELAGTTGLGEQGAANVLAGTSGVGLQGALNAYAGTTGIGVQGVLNRLAGTTGLGEAKAASLILPKANLVLNLDARNVNGYGVAPPADGAAVATWVDLSTAGSNATQVTGTNQPFYRAAYTNGQPAVDFDGVDNYMATASYTVSQPWTIYAVATFESTTAIQVLAGHGAPVQFGRIGVNAQLSLNAGSVLGAIAINTSPHVISSVFNGASSVIALDGGTPTTGAGGANTWAGRPMRIGSYDASTLWFNGGVSALLHYSGAHDATTRQRIERRLGRRFGITVA
jgi:hypothetical protein